MEGCSATPNPFRGLLFLEREQVQEEKAGGTMLFNLINFKKQLIINFLILFFISFLSPHDGKAEEREWKLMGKADNGRFLLYADSKSISYGAKNIFTIRVKKEVAREAFDE